MKTKFICLLIILIISSSIIFAEDSKNEPQEIDSITGFPKITEKPFIVFNEGVCVSWITRIQKQTTRSNFVFNDFLLGAYFGFTTVNMKPLNSTVRIAAFYPYSFTFNDVPQIAKQVLRYAFDLFAGPVFQPDMWNYVRFNLSPGIHCLYQMSDRFHYIQAGIGGLAGIELPLSARWTILINGIASLDYGNFGTNKTMEPYDWVYQYQLDFGVRYSKKKPNKYNYLLRKPKD